jgi:hypothetical protein
MLSGNGILGFLFQVVMAGMHPVRENQTLGMDMETIKSIK